MAHTEDPASDGLSSALVMGVFGYATVEPTQKTGNRGSRQDAHGEFG